MKINITQFFTLELEEANKILRIAYLKGYLKSCEVVQNGCDIFRYIPSTKLRVEIISRWKSKYIAIRFYENNNETLKYIQTSNTTKEMFDEAIECFKATK